MTNKTVTDSNDTKVKQYIKQRIERATGRQITDEQTEKIYNYSLALAATGIKGDFVGALISLMDLPKLDEREQNGN